MTQNEIVMLRMILTGARNGIRKVPTRDGDTVMEYWDKGFVAALETIEQSIESYITHTLQPSNK